MHKIRILPEPNLRPNLRAQKTPMKPFPEIMTNELIVRKEEKETMPSNTASQAILFMLDLHIATRLVSSSTNAQISPITPLEKKPAHSEKTTELINRIVTAATWTRS